MTAAEQTQLDNLLAAWRNATARLAELDAVPLDQRAKLTYTDGGQTYGWNEYRASQWAAVKAAREEYVETRKVLDTGNVFTDTTGTVRG